MKKNMELIKRLPYKEIEDAKYHSILFADIYIYKDVTLISDVVQTIISRKTKSYFVFHLN